MQDFKAQNPHLVALLEERLPLLGLDGETYGTYVLGTSDDEELQQVMELLQASSEEQDATIWERLTQDIKSKMKLDQDLKIQEEMEQKEQQRAVLEEQLAQAKQGIQPATTANNNSSTKHHGSAVDEATKKALLSRFAYEVEDDDEEDIDQAPLTNREVAAQASQEKAKELKSAKVTTKREEQQKTKEQRVNKQQLKEERRQRAQKGERKR